MYRSTHALIKTEKKLKRSINGILLLDKPKGWSSNKALQEVKSLFNAKKAGHTGSLDPLATGLLPICFGEATKFSQFLLEANKAYRVQALLGSKTTTGDAEGEIIQTRPVDPAWLEQLEVILPHFRGTISQLPPMYSALKFNGKPLYTLARQGITIERPTREVTIHTLKLLDSTATTLDLEIQCSKGTYIRTLIEDIGEALGCGAYVQMLRRIGVDSYGQSEMLNFETLQTLSEEARDQSLRPLDSLLPLWPTIRLSQAAAYYLCRGQAILLPETPKSGWVRLVSTVTNQFIGIGEMLADGRVAPRRLLELRHLA
ncbi:tRNA pseudouridine(55) synthase TruB [Rickettsiella massiliensis]|uniref:tRNA pseudouridine(55) synthase TruB n=1 Tax=Rickettsiella massiliensis TaxID=676517 RepID=UPI00029B13BC|nr:tRNA pseudouridine(55) synthase TruB [Rickettsiella massiliensis]